MNNNDNNNNNNNNNNNDKIRTISNIYNFKIMSYCLQIKKEIYVHDRKLL